MDSNDLYKINKSVNELLGAISEGRNRITQQEVERKLKKLERERYREEFIQSMRCNLKTCRYNNSGTCDNEEKRKECIEVSRRVLCMEE